MATSIIFSCIIIFLVECINSALTVYETDCDNDVADDLEIGFVSVIFRHGDRAPDTGKEMYPNDPYQSYDYYPQGLGGLTNIGKIREYELGTMLRRRYNDFLGPIYLPCNVMGISTDYERTKMSLQLVLAGLYPPRGEQIWNPVLKWQPIPTDYIPIHQDNLMLAEECPQYIEEFQRVYKYRKVQAKLKNYQPLMNNLTYWTGKPITTPNDMYYLYHSLMATYSMGLKLPNWANDVFPFGSLWSGTVLEYSLTNYNTKLRRLYGGMLLKNMTNTMIDIVQNRFTNRRKINLYSGHETNIVSFLATLGVYEPHVPEYSSAVILELLYDRNNKYYVSVYRYLGIPAELKAIHIPGCGLHCPLKEFMKMYRNVIPSEEEKICLK